MHWHMYTLGKAETKIRRRKSEKQCFAVWINKKSNGNRDF